MEKQSKYYFFITLLGILFILAITAIIIFIVDPYQQFRASDKYINDARLEIPGVAKYHNYNTVISGSSMMMNHNPKHIDSVFITENFAPKTRNFSIIGAMWDDLEIALPYILNQGKVKLIFLSLDYFCFAKTHHSIPKYLYDEDNVFAKFSYIYNYTTLENCINKIFRPCDESELYQFSSETGMEKVKNDFENQMKLSFVTQNYDYSFNSMKNIFDSHFYEIIKNARDVIWYIYYPPYSMCEFALYVNNGVIDDIINFKIYTIAQLLKIPNVRLFDFQKDISQIMNLDDYCDVRHHSKETNNRLINYMRMDTFRVTKNNYHAGIDSLQSAISIFLKNTKK